MADQAASQYGGFWIRVLAALVDNAILWIAALLMVAAGAFIPVAGPILATLGPLLLWLLYFPVMHASARQATLGKGLLGLKVVRADNGERISILRALARDVLGKLASGLILMLGYLMAAFTGRKQALHDKIASTVVVAEGPRHLVAALAVALGGFAAPFVLIMVLGVGIVAGLMGGIGAAVLGGMTGEQAKQAPKPAAPPAPAAAPATPAAAVPAGTPAPAAPAATAAADVDKLLVPVAGVDKPATVRAGPAVLELSTFFSGGDPKVWIRVHAPQAVSSAAVVITQVTDSSNQGRYDAKSTFETEFFQNVSLSESGSRKEGLRTVHLVKGTTEQQVQKVEGTLKLAVPLGTRSLAFAAADAGKEQAVGTMRLKLASIKGDTAALELQGSRDNILLSQGFNARGERVPVELHSWSTAAPQWSIKFKGPVERLELQVAAEIAARSYPFTLSRGGSAAVASAPAAAAKPAPSPEPAKPAAAPAPAPSKPTLAPAPSKPILAPAPVQSAPAPVAEAPKPKPAPRKRAAKRAAPVAIAPASGAAAPAAPVVPAAPATPKVAAAPKYSDLMTAVLSRDAAGVEELLAFGKWADKPDRRGTTPLMAAASLGDMASAEALLKAGADAQKAVSAARTGDKAMLDLLQRYGATLRQP